ncbi:glycine cleavage system protein R [Agaribacterium sp. ZY112]|uniref:glycine cleavage system protein R n=1 Tax=Agaribacterium sp. ZY112 TaxID=3233574 RepID=UPI00352559A5
MNKILVVSFFGEDQPGLVQDLAEITHELQGKWLQSKLSHLEGQLAGVLKIELPEEQADSLIGKFQRKPEIDIKVSEPQGSTPVPEHCEDIKISAKDRPGLVNDITCFLNKQGVKVLNFECQRMAAIGAAGNLFSALVAIELPEGKSSEDLVAQLTMLDAEIVASVA